MRTDQPMRNLKILGIAAAMVASAVIGGTLISVVAASGQPAASQASGADPTSTSDPTTTNATAAQPGVYCKTFLDEFAKQLGVDESALLPAAKAAADAAIDKAVANGAISQAIANQLKQRIANANGNMCGLIGARLGGLLKRAAAVDIVSDMAKAAADSLHLSVADLRTKLRGGESLKQIAADQKVDYATVTAAIHDAAKSDLDKLVAAGTLTAGRETAILARIDQALQNGRLGVGKVAGPSAVRPFRFPFLRPFGAAPSASPAPS